MQRLSALLEKEVFSEKLKTVYIGGGTPNFLTAKEMEKLFRMIHRLPLTDDCEISCELNPECLTADKMLLLNDFTTRLSVGVQSFSESVRNKLMRRCNDAQFEKAWGLLAKRKVKHLNIDLIYGVQSVEWELFKSDIDRALDSGADHLSCYSLTAEENSRLGLKAPVADDENSAEFWQMIGEYTSARGVRRYEVSNYAQANCECQHNMNVWSGDTLLGVGPAAAGFDGVDRFCYCESVEDFIRGAAPEKDVISEKLRMLEIWAVNLRTVRGWSRELWEDRYPGSWGKMYDLSQAAARQEPAWWQISADTIALTDAGLLFWDDAAMQILCWQEKL